MTGDVDEAKSMWQSQRTEHPIMSIEEIRTKAHVAHVKVRMNVVIALLLGLTLAVFSITIIVENGAVRFRLLAGAIMVVTAFVAYRSYQRFWPLHTMASSAALKGSVEFYREELRAQYRSVALWWRFLVPIIAFAFIRWNDLFRTSGRVPRTLLPVFLILILLARRQVARTFRRKLDALGGFEEERSDPDVSHI